MPSAAIQINGVTGSNIDLPIGTVVTLSNASNTGVTTWLWTILDQPAGAPDSLSSSTASSPTFTPHKEGTYLIRLNVNGAMSGIMNQVTAAVLQVKTRTRVPAAGETVESSSTEGWHGTALEQSLILLDTLRADPGVAVAQAGASGLVPGDVVAFTSDAVIKSGLPGQETVLVATLALANVLADVTWDLGVVVSGVNGSSSPASGALILVRKSGLFLNVNQTSPSLGGNVYVSDTGVMSATPGTNTRAVGRCVNVIDGTHFDVCISGSVGAGAAVLTGDVTGPVGANVLNSAIATAVTWSGLQTFTPAGVATDILTTAITTTLSLSAHNFDFIGAAANWQPTAGANSPSLNFQAYNTTPALVDAAAIKGTLTTTTPGGEISAMDFYTRTGGGAETAVMRLGQALMLNFAGILHITDASPGDLVLPASGAIGAGGHTGPRGNFFGPMLFTDVTCVQTTVQDPYGQASLFFDGTQAPTLTGTEFKLAPVSGATSVLDFQAYNSTPALVDAAAIKGILDVTTPGSEDGAIDFYTRQGGAAEARVARLGKSLMLGHTLDYTQPALSVPAQAGFSIAINDGGTLFPIVQSTNAYVFLGGTGYTTVIEGAGLLEIYGTTSVLLAGPGGDALTAYSSTGVYIGGTPADPGANNLTVQGNLIVNGTITGAKGAIRSWGGGIATDASATISRFLSDDLPTVLSTQGTAVQVPVPFACVVKNLYVSVYQNGASTNTTVTVFKNGSATTIVATITGGGSFSDLTHTVAFAAGDTIDLLVQNTAGGGGQFVEITASVQLFT